MVTEVATIIVRERGSRQAAANIRAVGVASRTASTSVRLLTTALLGLGVGLSLRGLQDLIDTGIRLDNQIKVVTSSTEEFVAVQAELNRIATETRAPLDTTVSLFRRLRVATRDLGASNSEVLKTVQGLNAAIIVSGANAQETRAGLIQFSQGLASGRLAGDELRTVLEALPPVAQALADELGVTVGQLRELGAAGELNANNVFPALLAISDQFNTQLQGLDFTIDQTANVLRNQLIDSIRELNQLFGASGTLNQGILNIADSLRGNLFGAVANSLEAFAALIETTSSLRRTLNDLGVNVLPGIGQAASLTTQTLILLIQQFERNVNAFSRDLNRVRAVGSAINFALGIQNEEEVLAVFQRLERSQTDFDQSTARVNQTLSRLGTIFLDIARNPNSEQAAQRFEDLGARARQAAADIRALADAPRGVPDLDVLDRPGTAVPVVDPKAAREAEKALNRLLRLVEQLQRAQDATVDPLNKQLTRLRQQQTELLRLSAILGDVAQIQQGLDLVGGLIEDNLARRADLSGLAAAREEDIRVGLEAVRDISGEVADDFGRQLEEIIRTSSGVEELARRLFGLQQRVQDTLEAEQTRVARSFADAATTGLQNAFGAALRGEVGSFSQFFADTLAAATQTAFDEFLADLQKSLTDIFKNLGDQLGGEGGLLGSVLGSALTVGGLLASAALQDSDTQVSRTGIRSAVDSSRELRGVVAGPTNIPIFQVGDAIENSFENTNVILEGISVVGQEQLEVLRALAVSLGGLPGGAADAGAAELLGLTTTTVA